MNAMMTVVARSAAKHRSLELLLMGIYVTGVGAYWVVRLCVAIAMLFIGIIRAMFLAAILLRWFGGRRWY